MRFLQTFQLYDFLGTLVSLSIEPNELDADAAGLAGTPGVRHATWNTRAL